MKVLNISALLLGLLATSYCYKLDISCAGVKDHPTEFTSLVNKALESAFDLATAGLEITNTLEPEGSGPVWKAQSDLFINLFFKATKFSRPDPDNDNWKTVRSVFQQVLGFRTSQKPNIVIFCDKVHFEVGQDCKENPNPAKACDEEYELEVNVHKKFNQCFGIDPDIVERPAVKN